MKSPEPLDLQIDLERARGEIDNLREELRKAVETAEQTRAEMRQRLQDLARDFRDPVTSVLGFSEVLGAANKSSAGEWNQVNAAGQQLLNLITTLENSSGPTKPAIHRQPPEDPITPFDDGAQVILYIEDNEPNFRLIQAILEDRPGISLHWASTGERGLEFSCKHAPSLILLDLNLPDIHGSKVLARLRLDPATATIPVIILSSDATPSQIERMLQAGARDYLIKPFEIKRLLCLVDEMLEPA